MIGFTIIAMLATVLQVSAAQADENAPIDIPCSDATLASDQEEAFADVVLPFAVDIGDGAVEAPTLRISENGYVGFGGGPTDWFEAFNLADLSFAEFIGGDGVEIIAPLFAQATTGAAGSVSYGTATYQGHDAFCINWTDMEPVTADAGIVPDPMPTNTFQLVLVDRSDIAAGEFDIIVNYDTIEWDDSYCPQGGPNGPIDVRQLDQCCADEEPFNPNNPNGPNDVVTINQLNECCPEFAELECCPVFDVEFGCCPIIDGDGCCPPDLDPMICCVEFGACPPPPDATVNLRSVFDDAAGESAPGHAGISFPSGLAPTVVAFPGSGIVDGMIGADGLAGQSLNSLQAGRYVIEVRNGFGDNQGSIEGTVVDDAGSPIEGAIVSVCVEQFIGNDNEIFLGGGFNCEFATTNTSGLYAVGPVALGDYQVTARAPADLDYFDAFETAEVFNPGLTIVDTIVMTGPIPPPDNVTFGPTSSWAQSTTVYFGEDLNLSVTGCVGGTAIWTVTASNGPDRTGSLTEGPDGTYAGVIPPLRPTHGEATVAINITCPDNSTEMTDFNIYIDPAGTILEVDSGEPIAGATVVLERRDVGGDAFTQVPDGSEIMSTKNRVNPFTTDDSGEFSWDVIPGEYRVSVSKADCTAIALPSDWTDRVLTAVDQLDGVPNASVTPVLTVLPEWLDLELFLDCNNAPSISVGDRTLEAPAGAADLADTPVTATDPDAGDVAAGLVVTNDAPDTFALGDTVVTWTVTDGAGAQGTTTSTVTVEDTTAPAITVPASVDAESTDGDPIAVTFVATAADANDGDVAVTCDPASGTDFAVGTTTVTCTASDASGNAADAASFDVTVSVVAAGDIRSDIASIAVLLEDTTDFDRIARWRAYRARWYLTYADNDRYWRDDNQVSDRNGARALAFMRIAASYMSRIDDPDVQAATLDLLGAMRTMASDKIDEAVAIPGRQSLIDAANSRLAVGDDRLSIGSIGSAGNNYRQAWVNAYWAIQRAE